MVAVNAYGMINEAFVSELRHAIGRTLAAHPIEVRVSSPGGRLASGITAFNLLKQSGREVHVYLDGDAFSAATMILAAADYSEAPSNALLMIHDPWVPKIEPGTLEEVKKVGKYLEATRRQALQIYAEQTKLPVKRLARMMREETYLDATAAVELGFLKAVTPASRGLKARAAGEYEVRDPAKLALMLAKRRVPKDLSETLKALGVNHA